MSYRKNEAIPIEPEQDLPIVDCHCHFPDKEPYRKPTHSHESQFEFFFEKHNGKFIISSSSDFDYDYVQDFMQTHDKMYMTMGTGIPTNRYPMNEVLKDYKAFLEIVENNQDTYVGIGEFGLDFHHGKTLKIRQQQIEQFQRVIHETKHLNKPYVLHVRNATQRDIDQNNPNHEFNQRDFCNKSIVRILEEEGIKPEKVMWHCFSGPQEWGPKLAKMGYYISIPSSAYGFKRWRRNIQGVPMDKLLTETDSCFQHPISMGGYNTPANVKYSVAAIAYVNEMKQQEVAEKVLGNAKKFFGIS
ncbi:MAG: TatD family hydrolase [Candidatus Heimdallarchaeota archaeon]|nr:TatD family hydrolase [Candidatus Heimdallarchaeota archaeon]MCK4877341.1 TatD family hydrolase [Candidatus Heimdallarchaeota archaeon]